MTSNATNSTSTSTAAPLPLTGQALIDHHNVTRADRSQTIADRAIAAGYVRPDGSADVSNYYNAADSARNELAAAAAGPDAWHGPARNGEPERFAFLIITDANEKQIGASLPIPAHCSGWSDRDTYAVAEATIQRHAEAYAAAADPDAFPLTVSIADRSGLASLFSIDSDGDPEDNLADGISRCENCNAIEDTDDGETVQVRTRNGWRFDSEHWCSDCVDSGATRCDDCDEYYPNEEISGDHAGRDVCSECLEHYSSCSDCGDLYHHDEMHLVDGSDEVCSSCINRGPYYRTSEGWSSEPDDDDDDGQGPNGMHRYNYHTDPNVILRHQIPSTGHTFGAEVEYKGSPSNWQAVAAACHRRAILTNDGTVSGEFVSVALTAGQIRRYLAALTGALTGTRNDAETGMHFHVDRRALTPWQWYTLSHYSARHAATLEAIGGRAANQWQNLRNLPANDWPTFARNWRNRSWPSRYTGINLDKGPTVELRFCRATKTPNRALARFGMVQRLIALGRLAPSQRPQTTEELRGWLAQDRYIRAETGWEPGPYSYSYKEACQKATVEGDNPPAPLEPEQRQTLQARLRTLQAELSLTERLRYNAYRQRSHPDTVWANDATARWNHYSTDSQRIRTALGAIKSALDAADAAAFLTE